MAFSGQPGRTAVPTLKASASWLRGHLPWLPSQTDSIQHFLCSRKWCRLDTELSAANSASSVMFVPQRGALAHALKLTVLDFLSYSHTHIHTHARTHTPLTSDSHVPDAQEISQNNKPSYFPFSLL